MDLREVLIANTAEHFPCVRHRAGLFSNLIYLPSGPSCEADFIVPLFQTRRVRPGVGTATCLKLVAWCLDPDTNVLPLFKKVEERAPAWLGQSDVDS